jgi:hypothetical protein
VCPPITPRGAHDARARTEGVSDAYAYAGDAHDGRQLPASLHFHSILSRATPARTRAAVN